MRLGALLNTREGQKHNNKYTMHNGKSQNIITNNKTNNKQRNTVAAPPKIMKNNKILKPNDKLQNTTANNKTTPNKETQQQIIT